MRIRRLPETLINQIAAGEVVERPSSALKELLENSLDAGASRVTIFLKDGGIEEIQILDNGFGMEPEDLLLSVERHATSKLAQVSDLDAIGTFGFRGEALSAIASVAEVEIRSRAKTAPQAYVLRVAHGVVSPELHPESGPIGTAVKIRGLFSRIPARQKFLRSFSTEFSHSAKVVREAALGNPGVFFSLHHQGRLIHSYASNSRLDRFKECLAPNWTPLHFVEEGVEFYAEAFLTPTAHTQDRGDVSLYINGRCVRHKTLAAAIRNTYLEVLGPGHEPSGVLYLEIRKDWVDVNVHPQKLEVRLLRQESLYQWLSAAIRKRLCQEIANAPRPTPESETFGGAGFEIRPGTGLAESQSGIGYRGRFYDRYLLCVDDDGVLLVDAHNLHAKLIFDRLSLQWQRGQLRVEPCSVAQVLRIDLKETWDVLRRHGFDLEGFGDGDVLVKSRPELIDEAQIESVLKECVRVLAETEVPNLTRAILTTLACQSAIRSDQALSPPEAERLLAGFSQIEEDWGCPHGRNISFRLRFQTIEKHFERL